MNNLTPTYELETIATVANEYASANVFAEYTLTKAENTLRAQASDLTAFSAFLTSTGARNVPTAESFMQDPDAWQHVTWGLVESFKRAMVNTGNSTGTINRRLATVKVYAKLAARAGVLTRESALLIGDVKGYTGKQAARLDERRETTRVGTKKARHNSLSFEQAEKLVTMHDLSSPQGRRDQLMVCLFLHHGFRVGEVAGLQVDWFNLSDNKMYVYRGKTHTEQYHELSKATLAALTAYIDAGDCPDDGNLWRKSVKSGELTEQGLTTRAIAARVRSFGEGLGINNLSPHDLRHYWATYWASRVAKSQISLLQLQEAGGWSAGSLAMLRRYVDEQKIANQGMVQ